LAKGEVVIELPPKADSIPPRLLADIAPDVTMTIIFSRVDTSGGLVVGAVEGACYLLSAVVCSLVKTDPILA
jgi:hypothetical protein